MSTSNSISTRTITRRLIAAMLICMLALVGCARGPVGTAPSIDQSSTEAAWSPAAGQLTRLDEDGYFYYLDYDKDYYSDEVMQKLEASGALKPACSAFSTFTLEGEHLCCHNYDMMHRVSKEDRTPTGLNVVLHCAPQGKYESIAVGDAFYCDTNNPLIARGGPDMDGFEASMVDTIPYECLDGVNEMGLAACILRVDIKEGEQPSNMIAGSSIMLRYLLDNCATVDEAIAYVNTSDLKPSDWQDCHIFVTDATGGSAVLESRNGEVKAVDTDVVTNFYVGYDDIADSYRNGKLRELAVKLVDEDGEQRYHFGYGHGYHRFVSLASQLEMRRNTDSDEYCTRMTESEALVMLQSVVQNEHTVAAGTSYTQFSTIYNNATRTLTVWSFQDWKTPYVFNAHGERSER